MLCPFVACSRRCTVCAVYRYKDDQERETKEAAEKAMLASMTEDERRRWEIANPKVQDCPSCIV